MSLVEQAERFAREAHASQFRKGGKQIPYFRHLASVAERLRQAGVAHPVPLAAAYLHDVLEDQPAHAEALRRTFPAEVVAVVELVTAPKLDDRGGKLPKTVRFERYLAGLDGHSEAHHFAALVSCADKIDNTRSLLDEGQGGPALLAQLSTRPGQYRRRFASLRALYGRHPMGPLLEAYDAAVADFEEMLVRWLPGRAVAIAASAHVGQFDQGGRPYILHPLRLMARATTDEERTVAVLHDVLEDTPWTLEQLAEEGFSPVVLEALDALTRREGEPYDTFLDRVLRCPLAIRVKLLDLEDNLDGSRLAAFGPREAARMEKYVKAHQRLRAALGRSA